MSKETIEEAAERLKIKWEIDRPSDFIKGATWQAERMYSEEDMEICWNAAYIDAMAIDEETYKPLFFGDFIERLKKQKP